LAKIAEKDPERRSLLAVRMELETQSPSMMLLAGVPQRKKAGGIR
jgi:hypothetical protein